MSKDATNLTNALKGETKTQGNWGEFILESLLEKSGLEKDREYFIQVNVNSQEGKRFQPDVIVKLPEKKSVIIDSKVSLVAYEKFSSAEDENERFTAIKEHILSIRNHIKNLSSKNYQNLYSLDGLDFVLMFLPIELFAQLQASGVRKIKIKMQLKLPDKVVRSTISLLAL